jgi:hypothetical protein
MFARMAGRDIDGDGIPARWDVNPLGNYAMGTGLQLAGHPRLDAGDADGDGVNDMLDLNPFGSFHVPMVRLAAPHLGMRFIRPPDAGDRFASRLLSLYPDRLFPSGPSLEYRSRVLGLDLGNRIGRLYPEVGIGRAPLEERFKSFGDPLGMKIARLYP